MEHHDTIRESLQLLPLPVQRNPTGTSHDNDGERGSQSKTRHPYAPWTVEAAAWAGSLGAFITIVALLADFNDEPLPEIQFGLTPNAIIGLLATMGETLLMFSVGATIGQLKWLNALGTKSLLDFRRIDEATRGPWGRFLMLVRGTGGFTAALGAMITVLALGISTFSQNAIHYPVAYHSTRNATVPVAHTFEGNGMVSLYGYGYIQGIDPSLRSAPFDGLYSPMHTPFIPPAQCATGNCSWGPMETLGICNTCHNVTQKLLILKVIEKDPSTNTSFIADHYTLPKGFTLKGIQMKGGSITNMMNVTTIWDESIDGFESIAFPSHDSDIFSVLVIGPAPGTVPAQPDADLGPDMGVTFAAPAAFECLFQFCVQTINARFLNNTLTETVVSTYNHSQRVPEHGSKPLPYLNFTSPKTGTSFTVTGEAFNGVQVWVPFLLNGNATVMVTGPTGDPALPKYVQSSLDTLDPIYDAMNSSATGFTDMMDNLANSLTLSIRTAPYQGAPAQGYSYSQTNRASIAWEWLILPLLELIASLILLIIAMIKTRKHGLVPWKNDILASMLHGFDQRPDCGRRERQTEDNMADEARGLMVRFEPNEEGGRLVMAG